MLNLSLHESSNNIYDKQLTYFERSVSELNPRLKKYIISGHYGKEFYVEFEKQQMAWSGWWLVVVEVVVQCSNLLILFILPEEINLQEGNNICWNVFSKTWYACSFLLLQNDKAAEKTTTKQLNTERNIENSWRQPTRRMTEKARNTYIQYMHSRARDIQIFWLWKHFC